MKYPMGVADPDLEPAPEYFFGSIWLVSQSRLPKQVQYFSVFLRTGRQTSIFTTISHFHSLSGLAFN